MKLNINTDEAVKFTNKLEKLHRSKLPNAVRNTLNKAAFDVKQNTMPQSASREFTQRKKNFFKATSRVDMAKGFDMKSMKATVGFLGGEKNQAIADLEKQEKGGKIGGRSFVPTDKARTGNNNNRLVSKKNRLSNINRIQDSLKVSGKTNAQKFIKAALQAGKGGHVLGNLGNTRILYEITGIKKIKGRLIIKKKAIYSYKDNRSVKVNATDFMKKATDKTASNLNKYFIQEAKKQMGK